jgi:hypothetical protein
VSGGGFAGALVAARWSEHAALRTDGAVSDRRTITVLGRPVIVAQPRDGRRLVNLDVVGLDGLV